MLAITATAIVVAVGGFLLDWALLGDQRNLLYFDGLAALIAALWAFVALSVYNNRQTLALPHLRTIAEVNHHPRNALTSVLYSVELTRNEPLIEMTRSAVERIDWTQREVLHRDYSERLQRSIPATEERKVS